MTTPSARAQAHISPFVPPRATRAAPLALLAIAALAGCSGSSSGSHAAPTLVSIAVTPIRAAVAHGDTRQFSATGTYSDGSTRDLSASVTWGSSDHSVATVSTGGLATTAALGVATITATASGVSTPSSASLVSQPAVTVATVPGGPSPSAAAPCAVAVDAVHGWIYAVHRGSFADVAVNADGTMPTDRVSVVDATDGSVAAAIAIGHSVNGSGQGIAVDAGLNRVFVTNGDDGTLSIIDGATRTVLATPSVGRGPAGVAVDPSSHRVFVANTGDGDVAVLDGSTGTLLGTVALGGVQIPLAVAVDATTHVAWVVASGPSKLFAIDGTTRAVLGSAGISLVYGLSGVAVIPGSRAFVSSHDTGTVVVFDTTSASSPSEVTRFTAGTYAEAVGADPTTGHVVVADSSDATVKTFDQVGNLLATVGTAPVPVALAVAPSWGLAFVANVESDRVSAVDFVNGVPAGFSVLGNSDHGVALDAAAHRAYSANWAGDVVSVLDTDTGALLDQWPTGHGPWAIALDPGLGQLYSANASDGTLTALDTGTGDALWTLAVGTNPRAVAVAPSTHRVYVAAGSSGSVAVVDGTTGLLVQTVTVGSGPAGVAVDDGAQRVYVANQQSGTISVIDAGTNAVLHTWTPPEANVWALEVDAGLHHLYVTIPPAHLGDFSGLEILDATTGAFLSKVATGNSAEKVAADPTTHLVFVTDGADGTVGIVKGTTGELLESVDAGAATPGVDGIAVAPGAGAVFVSNPFDGTVSRLTVQ